MSALQVTSSPSDEATETNLVYINPVHSSLVRFIVVGGFPFKLELHREIPEGKIAFNLLQRRVCKVNKDDWIDLEKRNIEVTSSKENINDEILSCRVRVSYFSTSSSSTGKQVAVNADEIRDKIRRNSLFDGQILLEGQPVFFQLVYQSTSSSDPGGSSSIRVALEFCDFRLRSQIHSDGHKPPGSEDSASHAEDDDQNDSLAMDHEDSNERQPRLGLFNAQSTVIREICPDCKSSGGISIQGNKEEHDPHSHLFGIGHSKSGGKLFTEQMKRVFQRNGIGGLEKECLPVLGQALFTRRLPPGIAKKLGLNPVKGILICGPACSGKLFLARHIPQLLDCPKAEIKLVNTQELLSKYVGEAENNIRRLFRDAKEDLHKYGEEKSPLHVICLHHLEMLKQVAANKDQAMTVTAALIGAMDGVEPLPNILVIATASSRQSLDSSLFKPGRFEVQLELQLPDFKARKSILGIQVRALRKEGRLEDDVRIEQVAEKTHGLTPAELAGVVRSACAHAFDRQGVAPSNPSGVMVAHCDFVKALEFLSDQLGDFHPGEEDARQKALFGHALPSIFPSRKDQLNQITTRVKLLLSIASSPVFFNVVSAPGNGGSTLAKLVAAGPSLEMQSVRTVTLKEAFDACSRLDASSVSTSIQKSLYSYYKNELDTIIDDFTMKSGVTRKARRALIIDDMHQALKAMGSELSETFLIYLKNCVGKQLGGESKQLLVIVTTDAAIPFIGLKCDALLTEVPSPEIDLAVAASDLGKGVDGVREWCAAWQMAKISTPFSATKLVMLCKLTETFLNAPDSDGMDLQAALQLAASQLCLLGV